MATKLTNIRIPDDLLIPAKIRAKKERRTLAGYIKWLISKDLDFPEDNDMLTQLAKKAQEAGEHHKKLANEALPEGIRKAREDVKNGTKIVRSAIKKAKKQGY